MGRLCFFAGGALLIFMCWHYSFWVVFGWAYAAASLALIFACFTYKRRHEDEGLAVEVTRLQSPQLELEANK